MGGGAHDVHKRFTPGGRTARGVRTSFLETTASKGRASSEAQLGVAHSKNAAHAVVVRRAHGSPAMASKQAVTSATVAEHVALEIEATQVAWSDEAETVSLFAQE